MTWSEVAFIVATALLLLLWWLWVAANRLDRLHRKVQGSLSALDNQLVRRASVAVELAGSGLLDPASSVLVAESAWSALAAGGHGDDELVVPGVTTGRTLEDDTEREVAESELSRTLRAALDEESEVAALEATPLGAEILDALVASWYRVQLARRFHNEAVAQTQRMRRKMLVRALRLHGHAPVPQTVEIDDAWPEVFGRRGQRT